MILLDIEKACDTVWLNGLLFKLLSFHMPDYLLFPKVLPWRPCLFFPPEWFYLHLKTYPSGLPQGALISITLFSLFLTYMPLLPPTHLALHADDTALLSQSWRPDTTSRILSDALMTLLKCFTTWTLRLNTHKTETLFSQAPVLPSRPSSNLWGVSALDFDSTLFRPCARLTTSLHHWTGPPLPTKPQAFSMTSSSSTLTVQQVSPLHQCFSTAGPRPDTGPWHQLYRTTRDLRKLQYAKDFVS